MKKRRGRGAAGFTLAEVLVTLGIISILAAVAVPAVFVLQKNLKMHELDACAREIFLAAQNSLTEKKADGTLARLSATLADGEEDALLYISEDSAAAVLLPAGAIDPTVASNHFLIAFDPQTGTVREVFYGENTSVGAEDAQALRSDREERRTREVGYYAGGGVETGNVRQLPVPAVVIENGETLTAKITVPAMEELDPGRIRLTVTVKGEGGSKIFVAGGDSHALAKPNALGKTELLLDSLTPGGHFKDIFSDCTIVPGSDLTITVTLEPEYQPKDGPVYLPSTVTTAAVSSLFASRSGEEVTIACARHLQNLDKLSSGVTDKITCAVQARSIDWATAGLDLFTPIQNGALLAYDGKEHLIRNLVVRDTGGDAFSCVGLFHSMLGQKLDFKTRTLSNIRIVNPTISSARGNAGALAGALSFVEVTNCMVYAEQDADAGQDFSFADYYVSGGNQVGGLVGEARSCKFERCAAGLALVVHTGGSGAYLGGLLGYGDACYLSNSYADVDKLTCTGTLKGDTARIGMLAGCLIGTYQESVQITGCYAAGNLSLEFEEGASGFSQLCGEAGGAINNSYAAVTLNNWEAEFPAPFSGKSPDCNSCAYLIRAKETVGDPRKLAGYPYELLPTQFNGGNMVLVDIKSSHPYRETLLGSAYPFPAIKDLPHYGSWPEEPPDTAGDYGIVYYEIYRGADGKPSYGYYGGLQDGDLLFNTLKDDRTVLRDGYALLCKEAVSKDIKITFNGGKGNDKQSITAKTAPTEVIHNGVTYYLYVIPKEIVDPEAGNYASPADEAATLEIGHGSTVFATLTWNPYFAKTNVRKPGDPYLIRTPRQLRHLALATNEGGGSAYAAQSYKQEIDLDYATYLKTPENQNDGLDGAGISGVSYQAAQIELGIHIDGSKGGADRGGIYDGGNHTIFHLVSPLFSSISGTVTNTHIAAASITGRPYTGIFAYSSSGKISSSSVRDSSIINSQGLSGFIDQNTGLIDKCSVYRTGPAGNMVIGSDGTYGAYGFIRLNSGYISAGFVAGSVSSASDAAGFAGTNGNGTGIHYSYANCETFGQSSASGFVTTNMGSIANCYSLLSVRSNAANGTAAGFSAQGGGSFSNCYSAALLEGKALYGFAAAGNTDNWCYWLRDEALNADVTDGAGAKQNSYQELRKASFNGGEGIWQSASVKDSHPYAKNLQNQLYPFPKLIASPHYGDWPLNVKLPEIGVYTMKQKRLDVLDYVFSADIQLVNGTMLSGELHPTNIWTFISWFLNYLTDKDKDYTQGVCWKSDAILSGWWYSYDGSSKRQFSDASGKQTLNINGSSYIFASDSEISSGTKSTIIQIGNSDSSIIKTYSIQGKTITPID